MPPSAKSTIFKNFSVSIFSPKKDVTVSLYYLRLFFPLLFLRIMGATKIITVLHTRLGLQDRQGVGYCTVHPLIKRFCSSGAITLCNDFNGFSLPHESIVFMFVEVMGRSAHLFMTLRSQSTCKWAFTSALSSATP